MTLGPTIALMPLVESSRGAIARWLTVFGRVPSFYVLHIPLIHALVLVVCDSEGRRRAVALRESSDGQPAACWLRLEPDAALCRVGRGDRSCSISCRWFAGVKATRQHWWFGYP